MQDVLNLRFYPFHITENLSPVIVELIDIIYEIESFQFCAEPFNSKPNPFEVNRRASEINLSRLLRDLSASQPPLITEFDQLQKKRWKEFQRESDQLASLKVKLGDLEEYKPDGTKAKADLKSSIIFLRVQLATLVGKQSYPFFRVDLSSYMVTQLNIRTTHQR